MKQEIIYGKKKKKKGNYTFFFFAQLFSCSKSESKSQGKEGTQTGGDMLLDRGIVCGTVGL